MQSFLKTLFACFIAIITANIVTITVIFVSIGFVGSLFMGGSSNKSVITSGSVLEITLDEQICDNPEQPEIKASLTTGEIYVYGKLALYDLIKSIDAAATDPRIDAIVLNLNPYPSVGLASLSELRDALMRFKATSNKPIISYAENYSQASYFLASVADRIYLNPSGALSWKGMSTEALFYKGTLDKLGIEAEPIRHGRYKSAIEPFTQESMSADNRAQTEALISSIWNDFVAEVAALREGVDSTSLQRYASSLEIETPEDGVRLGLIDSLLYEDQFDKVLDSLVGLNRNTVALADYSLLFTTPSTAASDRVEIIYAEGEIVDGKGEKGMVGSEDMIESLQNAIDDDNICAVVLRVNSPGGSAQAADIIARKVAQLKETKPVVVSMGDYAASGGYYIAAPADMICASPATVTGSIGVFGLTFNIGGALDDKLGVTSSVVNSNDYSDFGSLMRPMSQYEKDLLQRSVDRTYDRFVDIVAQGRNCTRAEIDSIAQGRVWSGTDAMNNKLVDINGGLHAAVTLAASMAGLSDFTVTSSQKAPDTFGMILNMLSQQSREDRGFVGMMTEKTVAQMESLERLNNRVSAFIPYKVVID